MKKKLLKTAKKKTPPMAPLASNTSGTPTIAEGELKDMFLKIKKQSEELKKQTDELYDTFTEITGKTPKELEKLISNPHNFSDGDWKNIQNLKIKQEQEFEKLYAKMGLNFQKIKKKKANKQAAKHRARLGSKKKKNWIPVK